MNTKSLTSAVALAALLGCSSAFAQATDSSSPMPAPNQIVYLPQLPAAADLAKAAPSQGVTIAQITQTSDQLTVVYKLTNGQTNAVQYRLLSAMDASAPVPASAVGVPVPSTPGPAVAIAAPSTAVVYTSPAPAYPYYNDPYYYGPWYGPIGVSLGFGWGWHGGGGWGWRGGGWRGGGWRGGGWHGR
jgi:hypothetical protein